MLLFNVFQEFKIKKSLNELNNFLLEFLHLKPLSCFLLFPLNMVFLFFVSVLLFSSRSPPTKMLSFQRFHLCNPVSLNFLSDLLDWIGKYFRFLWLFLLFCFVLPSFVSSCFEIRSHNVIQPGTEFTMEPRLTLNSTIFLPPHLRCGICLLHQVEAHCSVSVYLCYFQISFICLFLDFNHWIRKDT